MYPRTHVTGFRRALVAGGIVLAILLLSRATTGVRAQAPDLTDTTAADFNSGTVGAGTSVANAEGGEVILLPTFHQEFSGAGVPTDWTSAPWSPPAGTTSFAGGQATIDGTVLTSNGVLAAGQSL